MWFSSVLHAAGRRDKAEGHATRTTPGRVLTAESPP
jgi:hypothetical protein